jgi:hypothetical protein
MLARKGTTLDAENFDPSAPAIRGELLIAAAEVSDCKGAALRTAYEVGAYGVPKSNREQRILDMQKRAAKVLKDNKSPLTIRVTGKFDPQTRDALPELRRVLKLPASNKRDVDPDLREKIGEKEVPAPDCFENGLLKPNC